MNLSFKLLLVHVHPLMNPDYWPTSWHDLTTVLQGQWGQTVLCVHTHHSVTEALHGEDASTRSTRAGPARSVNRTKVFTVFIVHVYAAKHSKGKTGSNTWISCSLYSWKKTNLICIYIADGFKPLAYYLLIETVNASEELAHGHIASGFNPLLWNKFRNASQEVKDPVEKAVTS